MLSASSWNSPTCYRSRHTSFPEGSPQARVRSVPVSGDADVGHGAGGSRRRGPQPAGAPAGDVTGPDDDTIEAGEADAEMPRRRLIRWNEYEGPFFTIRVGGGVLYDYAAFSQDDESAQQLQLELGEQDARRPRPPQGATQVQAARHLVFRTDARRRHRFVARPRDRPHVRRAGDLGSLSSSVAPRKASRSTR